MDTTEENKYIIESSISRIKQDLKRIAEINEFRAKKVTDSLLRR